MALNTYSDLKTTVANYLGRTDLTSQIPDFINLAEIRLSRDLRIREMVTTVTLNCTGGVPSLNLPADFLEIRDIYVVGAPRSPITYMSPSMFSREARADDGGKPVFYTVYNKTAELAPIPDTNYEIRVMYYAKPAALSDSNTTNAFLSVCPDALLYASLAEAEPYLMNDARIQVWATMYDRSLAAIADSDESSEYAGVPLQMNFSQR
jgi:hypothetical protein